MEDVITPTPSNGSLSTGDFSDSEVPNSDGSRMSIQIEREQSTGTVVEANHMEKEKLKVALKLDRLNIIPNGLRTYLKPSIGNRDDVFLEGWHGILFDCSKKLINHSVDFSYTNQHKPNCLQKENQVLMICIDN